MPPATQQDILNFVKEREAIEQLQNRNLRGQINPPPPRVPQQLTEVDPGNPPLQEFLATITQEFKFLKEETAMLRAQQPIPPQQPIVSTVVAPVMTTDVLSNEMALINFGSPVSLVIAAPMQQQQQQQFYPGTMAQTYVSSSSSDVLYTTHTTTPITQ